MNYKLLAAGCMVSALDPHGPSAVGTIWKPYDSAERDEAVALRHVGYAEETTAKPTAKKSTTTAFSQASAQLPPPKAPSQRPRLRHDLDRHGRR